MELSLEELNLIYQAIRNMSVNGRPHEVAKYYEEKVKPLEVKLADEIERRKSQQPAPSLPAAAGAAVGASHDGRKHHGRNAAD